MIESAPRLLDWPSFLMCCPTHIDPGLVSSKLITGQWQKQVVKQKQRGMSVHALNGCTGEQTAAAT